MQWTRLNPIAAPWPDRPAAAGGRMTMMARNKEENSAEWDQIEIGDQVRHPKWNVGTVLFRSGMGNNAKAIVVFPEEGQKKLMLKHAKLKKVGTTSLKSVEKMKAETQPKAPLAERLPDEEVPLDIEEAAEGDGELMLEEEDAEVAGFDDEDDEFGPRGAQDEEP
jgi:hypothetical protein